MSDRSETTTSGIPPTMRIAIIGMAYVTTLVSTTFAQREQTEPIGDESKYFGVQACVQCHRSADGNIFAKQSGEHIRLDEYTIWHERDKHSLAYCVLEGDLGRRMGELLGIKDVTTDARCTNCHAPQHEKTHMDAESHRAEGVSCEVCHGAAERWFGPHQFVSWRGVPAERKQSEFGMFNVEDPVGRAKLCISCHVGDQPGGVVTHDMYAAGHPPLPSVEVGFFSDEMPRHWWYPNEKRAARGSVNEVEEEDDDEDDFARTKLAVIGGAVALGASLDLIAHHAADENSWPELAQFDCSACHHDLRYPSWRQRRGYRGRPGRPMPRVSPLPLVQLGTRLSGRNEGELDAALAPLFAAFDARPFGAPDSIRAAAEQLRPSTEALVRALSKKEFDQAGARQALVGLCEIAAGDPPDYDAARQIAWALKTIYTDLYPDTRVWDPRADRVFEQLDGQLRMSFPPRPSAVVVIGNTAVLANGQAEQCADQPTDGPITAALPESLGTMSAYDPKVFQRSVAEFAALLAPP